MNKLKLGSLFDGIGGFPFAGLQFGIEPVWASEIEPFPIKVTQHHFPNMKHLGDITKIDGSEIEPVDIITFGSPCQDLSVAGKRKGLGGERSGLFMDAVRIIRGMRDATDGKYPRFIVWENVPGAFSSNNGEDFRAVLEEIAETEIPMPRSGKWATAGMVRTRNCDLAWRCIDAQHWGVPQRRRRIFLVADFAGECAEQILFEQEGLRRDFAESRETREEIAGTVGSGVKKSIGIDAYNFAETGETAACFNASSGGSPTHSGPMVMVKATDYLTGWDCQEKRIFSDKGVAPTLAGSDGGGGSSGVGYICLADQGGQQMAIHDDISPTLRAQEHGHQPLVMREVSRTLRAGAGAPKHESDWESLVIEPQIAYPDPAHSLLAKANMSFRDDVDTVVTVDCRNLCENKELSGTLQCKQTGGYSLNYQNPVRVGYAVRRLTPVECLRLQGFPDDWLNIDGMADTQKYKAVGNSVAIPCVEFVLGRMALQF